MAFVAPPDDLFGPNNDEYVRTTPHSRISPPELVPFNSGRGGSIDGGGGGGRGSFRGSWRGGRGGRGGRDTWRGGGRGGGGGGSWYGAAAVEGGGGAAGEGPEDGRLEALQSMVQQHLHDGGSSIGGGGGGGSGQHRHPGSHQHGILRRPDYHQQQHGGYGHGMRGGGRGPRGGGRGGFGGDRGGGPPAHILTGPAFQVMPQTSNASQVSVAKLGVKGHHDANLRMHKTDMQQPAILGCYSRTADGTVHHDDERCLRELRPDLMAEGVVVGRDLNEGFSTFVEKREDEEDGGQVDGGMFGSPGNFGTSAVSSAGFGAVLYHMRKVIGYELKALLGKGEKPRVFHFVTFRNNLNKMMTSCYNRDDAWEMGVHRRHGTVYLDVRKRPEAPPSEHQKRSCYYGYSFEHLVTRPGKSGRKKGGDDGGCSDDGNDDNDQAEASVVDANVEYCSVVKTKIGPYRILMGAEIDCYEMVPVRPEQPGAPAGRKREFVELKTALVLETDEQKLRFKRDRLLKYFVQSFVAGVKSVVCGFRTRDGRVVKVERMRMGDIAARAEEEWQWGSVLTFTKSVFDWVYGTAKDGMDYVLRYSPQFSRMELVLAPDGCPAVIEDHVRALQGMGY